ncbi:ATP-binding protein, partial [Bacillus pumilus]
TDRPKFTENDVQHIFERYPANHDSAGKNESNTELYLAREYVQAMQGELYTRCNNEGGIDFCLSIPNGDTRQ